MSELHEVIEKIMLDAIGEPEEAEQDGTKIKNRSLDELLRARAQLNAAKTAADPLGAIRARQRKGNSAV